MVIRIRAAASARLYDGRIYRTGRAGIRVLDVRDPLRPTRGAHVPIPLLNAVIAGGRLYALDALGTRILVFELVDARRCSSAMASAARRAGGGSRPTARRCT